MRLSAKPLFAAAALAAGLALAACGGGGPPASAEGDMSMGRADAPVTVIEYASVTCSHCASFNEQAFPEFKRRYVDTGRVRYVMREFLTPPEPLAAQGFMLARCAGPDRYFQVVDAIFRGQGEIGRTGDARGVLLRIAQSVGMNEERFRACVTDEAALGRVNDRLERAIDAGVTGTPTFVVNGRTVAEGEVSLAQLSAAIDPLLGANAPAGTATAPSASRPAAARTPAPASATNPAPAATAVPAPATPATPAPAR